MSARAGFSTVELLITLFVAALFLGAGYLLYNTIVRESGGARRQARASNVAYRYLRTYSDAVPASCVEREVLADQALAPPVDTLPDARVWVTYSCPEPGLTKVEVTVRYGREEVTHALYAQP